MLLGGWWCRGNRVGDASLVCGKETSVKGVEVVE